MSSHDSSVGQAFQPAAGSHDLILTIRTGLLGGLVGGVVIWIYEALIWVGVQHLMPMAGIPRNATGLVFGKQMQESLGDAAYVSTGIHFFFALPGVCCLRTCGRCSDAADTRRRWWRCSMRS